MITPAKYEITAYQGATFDKVFTVSDTGVPVNWTGYTASMQVRRYADSDVILTPTVTLGGTAGTITVTAAATATAAVPAGNYVYDIELTSGAYVVRILQGKFVMVGEVTRV